jgi:hypothetical protein
MGRTSITGRNVNVSGLALVTSLGGMGSAIEKAVRMEELHPQPRLDVKAVLFLVVTLGLAALELWGFVRLF